MASAVSGLSVQRVLITGSAGFIGSHLVRDYLASRVPVRAIVHALSRLPDSRRTPPSGPEYVPLDLSDPGTLGGAFLDCDLVIHAAAMMRAHDRQSRQLQERANVEMTRNVIQACRRSGVRRLLHVSSTAAIGISSDPSAPADETFPFNLDHLDLSYNISKRRSEQLALEANGRDLETVVVNPGFVFGRHGTRYRGGEVIARILDRSVVMCTGGGLSMVHVDDVIAGIRGAAAKGVAGERYILSGENQSFRAIADIVATVAGVRRTVVRVPDAARDLAGLASRILARARGGSPSLFLSRRYAYQFYSSDKACLQLGYQPRAFGSIVADYLTVGRGVRANGASEDFRDRGAPSGG